MHPVALLASFPSSKNSAAAPHLRFFRRLFTLPSMVQSSQRGSTPQFNVCARGLTWKGCIDNVEKPNACHRLGSARRALFMPRHLDRVSVIRSWTVPDFCLVLHQYRLGSVRCSCHVTSTESLYVIRSWTVPDFCLVLHQ